MAGIFKLRAKCLFASPFLSSRLSTTSVEFSKSKNPSSSRWLNRQNMDVYVKQAKRDSYRARSAYKLIELDDKYQFLKPSSIVIDCGARPGSWSQVAAERTRSRELDNSQLVTISQGAVIAVDIDVIEPLPGVIVLSSCDFRSQETTSLIKSVLKGHKADIVLSDMAPNASGLHQVDHDRILELCNSVYEFSQTVLKDGGAMICKVWQGSGVKEFKQDVKKLFERVVEHRPKATRKESSEVFIYASNFKNPSIPSVTV